MSYYIITILIVLILVGLNKLLNKISLTTNDSVDNEKLSPFECGILEIGDARQKFDIHFYLIAILFLIFDLEIVLVFPYVTMYKIIGFYGYIGFLIIINILTIGLIIELKTLIPKQSNIQK